MRGTLKPKFVMGFGLGSVLSVLVLGGCDAPPRLPSDMVATSKALHISSAHGPLSAEQAKTVIEKLRASRPNNTLLERHLAIEQALVGSPLVIGNRVVLLHDGASTFRALFNAIKLAKDHVNVETYIIEDDELGNQFADLLIRKRAEGVLVNLLYDSVGSLTTPAAFFRRLKDAGINVLEFNPVNPLTAKAGWNINHRDHRKLIIVDGRIAFLGGVNISSVYSGGSSRQRQATRPEERAPWRDTHLQIEGPVVAELQKLFLASWRKQNGAAPAPRHYFPALAPSGRAIVRAIGSSPDDAFTLTYATLISAIQNAESEVYLTNAYFVPDPNLLVALQDAARRGVDVRLILPGYSDSWLTLYAGRSHYESLLEAGVKIYERRNRLLHAKTAVIDGVWSTVGSTNLDWRSFLHNDELNAVVLGAEFAGKMKSVFEHDLAESRAITLRNWRNRPLATRIREAFARLWERVL